MKVKLLKKLRKRFEWKWDNFFGHLKCIDHLEYTAFYASTIPQLLQAIMYKYKGTNIQLRLDKRDDRVRYFKMKKRMRD